MTEKITSLQNPRIRNILKLQKASERKEQKLCTVEGFRELRMAIEADFEVAELYYCPEIVSSEFKVWLKKHESKLPVVVEIGKNVFERVAYREGTEGIYALVRTKDRMLNDLVLRKNPLLLALEAVEKPGNLGAVLRTADAAALDAVIICDPHTDIFNPNVIRSSIGAVFTVPVVSCSSDELVKWLREKGIKSCAAVVEGSINYHEADYTLASAIIMGTESTGLTKVWMDGADERIRIPMSGRMDSLNVSTSAAIIVFEAMRQRKFSKS